jgi:hypothetical protein
LLCAIHLINVLITEKEPQLNGTVTTVNRDTYYS